MHNQWYDISCASLYIYNLSCHFCKEVPTVAHNKKGNRQVPVVELVQKYKRFSEVEYIFK